MTAPSLSLTEAQTLTALRDFLLAVLPAGIEVVRGIDNRVPEPDGTDFVVMTPLSKERLATNQVDYDHIASMSIKQENSVTVQLDLHGPNSADNTDIVTALFRDDFAVEQFKSSGFDVTPLYTSNPNQIPFMNGEQQYELRWVVDCVMQCNPVVTTPMQFATSMKVNLVDVDAEYPA